LLEDCKEDGYVRIRERLVAKRGEATAIRGVTENICVAI